MSLDLLPASGLDLSVLLVVLAGTLGLWLLTETLGWSFAGLVVPGYLASVGVVAPAAGATVVAEALVTALVVGVVSDGLARTGVWTRFFGRERFLLVVVVSVLVRQASEVWALPWLLGRWPVLQPQDAHSVGLVLVPLTANALNKGSIGMGLRQLVLPTLVAYAVLSQVLLPWTNVSLGSMSLTYEDVALDFLYSARAYFVLAVGAMLATWLNGWLAWSAGGILVPALLALAWAEPERVGATMVEAVALVGVYKGLVRLPGIRAVNLEGPRKLATLFALATLVRVALGWAHDLGAPIAAGDWSGLGYLLSALIAQKILQVGSIPSVILPALATSGAAWVGGHALAWSIEQVLPRPMLEATHTGAMGDGARLAATPAGATELARLRVRLDPTRAPSARLPAAVVAEVRRFWRETGDRIRAGDGPPAPPSVLTCAEGPGTLGGRAWVLVQEAEPDFDRAEGWGVAILRPGARGGALRVDRPWREAAIAEGALDTCVAEDCAAVYFAGFEGDRDDARAAFVAGWPGPVRAADAPHPWGDAALPDGRLGDLVGGAIAREARTWAAAPADIEHLTENVVPVLGRWARGEAPAAEVVHHAGMVGWDVWSDAACGPCLVLVPQGAGPVVAVRAGGEPMLIEVSHTRREIGTGRVGLGAFAATRAMFAVFDLAEPPVALPVRQDPLHALHLGVRRELAPRDGASLVIRGLAAAAPGEPRPDVPVVVGAGRPVIGAPPTALVRFAVDGRLGGVWPFRFAAAGPAERGLAGNHVHTLQADLALGGVTPAVIWLSEAARDAWRTEPRDALAPWVEAAGLGLGSGDGAAGVGAGDPLVGASASSFDELFTLAREAAHHHHLNLLRRLVERAAGHADVSARWDSARDLAFLEVAVTDGPRRAVGRAWLVEGDGRLARVPLGATADQVRAALGWMPADVVAQ